MMRQSYVLLEQIVNDTKPLFERGGIARNNYLQQVNQLQVTKSEIATLENEN